MRSVTLALATLLALANEAEAGVNGSVCRESAYNCKLRPSGGNRVATSAPDDDDTWAVAKGLPVRDGDGAVLGTSRSSRLRFNYGQVRRFAGEDHALATSTSNGSAGWFPISGILGAASFEQKVGHVSAHSTGLGKLGCYRIRDASEPAIELKKVVYDSHDKHERAGDYLPLLRANGRRSANLCFNTPGFALGGVAIDHFPAGTLFQRLEVPTDARRPSIDVPLWVEDAQGRYRRQSGTLKFVYGYVIAATGTKRVGWMAYPALEPAQGCP